MFKFKVGPIRKIVFVPRNTESLIYLLWHGEIVMAGPGCGLNIKFNLNLPTQLLFLSWQ